jgi:hypothetical protein
VDSVPILIHLDFLLDNAPIHVIAAPLAKNLDIPFNILYQLKDDVEKMMSTFRDSLRVNTSLMKENELCSIRFQTGASISSCFCLPSVLKQCCSINKQLTSSASAAASERVNELLLEASPEERANLKGKGKRSQKKSLECWVSTQAKHQRTRELQHPSLFKL